VSKIEIASPWAPYGLSDDPYFQQPLEPDSDPDATRPISLFVGRDEEIRLLGGQVVGSSSSRAVVQGTAGVGKTSFVNRLKVALSEHDVLTHAEPVRVTPGMTPRRFVAAVLKVLNQMRASLTPSAATVSSALARAAGKAKRAAVLGEEDAFWQRVGRIVDGEDSLAGGVSFAAFGAQQERVRIPAEVEEMSLDDELARAVAYLTRRGTRRVLIHVDNLENLSRDDARAAAGLMQDVRDALLVEHSHWLFVGTTDIEDQIFRATPQVGGIVPFAVTLEPLEPAQVAELLERRYRHLQRGRRLVAPVRSDVAAELYVRYRGHLRDFLRLLSAAVQRQASIAPGLPLSAEEVVALMQSRYYQDVLVKRVGSGDAEHLRVVLAGKSYDAEFRAVDVRQATGMSHVGAGKLIRRLVDAGVAAPVRASANSTYFRVISGDATVALGLR
jgi:hypothetical protein